MPWSASDAQGHAGFAWTWLGAAMQATGLTFGATDAEAERTAENWKFAAIADTDFKADVAQPRCFDAAVAGITPADLRRAIRISASAEQHAVWIAADLACGVDRVYVHHVGASDAEQARFLERCAPALVRL